MSSIHRRDENDEDDEDNDVYVDVLKQQTPEEKEAIVRSEMTTGGDVVDFISLHLYVDVARTRFKLQRYVSDRTNSNNNMAIVREFDQEGSLYMNMQLLLCERPSNVACSNLVITTNGDPGQAKDLVIAKLSYELAELAVSEMAVTEMSVAEPETVHLH